MNDSAQLFSVRTATLPLRVVWRQRSGGGVIHTLATWIGERSFDHLVATPSSETSLPLRLSNESSKRARVQV